MSEIMPYVPQNGPMPQTLHVTQVYHYGTPQTPKDPHTRGLLIAGVVMFAVFGLAILGLLNRAFPDNSPRTYPTTPAVSKVWTDCGWVAPKRDIDGRLMVPMDINGNGKIECSSDIEMGS